MLIWKKTWNKSQKLEIQSAVTQFYKFFLLLTYNFECKPLFEHKLLFVRANQSEDR